MDRRQLLKGALAWPFAFADVPAFGKDPIYIADMHYHLLFVGPNTPANKPMAKSMAAGGATLVAWSLVGDLPWIRPTARGFKQTGVPKPGEAVNYFKEELARVKAHLAEQKLKIVKTAADVDLALKGEPHVVLAFEGANFLDNDLAQLQAAYDEGVRHIQLVHYTRNAIGDIPDRAARAQRTVGASARRSWRSAIGWGSSSTSRTARAISSTRPWRSPRRRWCGRTAR